MKTQIMIWLVALVSAGVFILPSGCSQKEAVPKPLATATGIPASPTVTLPSETKTKGAATTPVGRIAFISSRDNIHVIDADGKNERRLTSGWSPAWSPDGERLAYVSAEGVFTCNVDGSGNVKVATSATAQDIFGPGYVAWSPDGRKLFYIMGETGGRSTSMLWVADADGSSPVKIDAGGNIWRPPSFSPDGKRLAVGIDPSGPQSGIFYTLNSDGTGSTKPFGDFVNNSNELYESMAWAPKGNRIAYVAHSSLVVVDSDGSNKVTIATPLHAFATLAWAPDGGRIAYGTYDNELFIANADGTGKRRCFTPDTIRQFLAQRAAPRVSERRNHLRSQRGWDGFNSVGFRQQTPVFTRGEVARSVAAVTAGRAGTYHSRVGVLSRTQRVLEAAL